MEQHELISRIEELKDKLARATKQLAGLRQKSKLLEMQYDDARTREHNNNELVMELLERQRELNVMLNRTNIMLNRTQEAMALTSLEFNEMAKALPEPKKAEWSDRVARINDLFKKTGIQDAEVTSLESTNPPHPSESLDTEELKQESQEAFGKRQSVWEWQTKPEPPQVEVQVVEDAPPAEDTPEPEQEVLIHSDSHDETASEQDGEAVDHAALVEERRKSWWQRIAG